MVPTRSMGTIKCSPHGAKRNAGSLPPCSPGLRFASSGLRWLSASYGWKHSQQPKNDLGYNSDAGLEFIQDHKLWNDSANLGMKKPMRLEPHRLVCPTRRTLSNCDACCSHPQKYGNWRTLNHEDYAAIADCTQYTKFEICIRYFLRFWRHGVLYERQKPCPNQNTFSM